VLHASLKGEPTHRSPSGDAEASRRANRQSQCKAEFTAFGDDSLQSRPAPGAAGEERQCLRPQRPARSVFVPADPAASALSCPRPRSRGSHGQLSGAFRGLTSRHLPLAGAPSGGLVAAAGAVLLFVRPDVENTRCGSSYR
jgi:hypothetical protein